MERSKLNELIINDEGFAFDPVTGDTYNINPAGLLIMNAIKAGARPDQILDSVVAHYNVDRQTADRDVEVFLNELQRNKLIELAVES